MMKTRLLYLILTLVVLSPCDSHAVIHMTLCMEGDTLSSPDSLIPVYDLAIRHVIYWLERDYRESNQYYIELLWYKDIKYSDPPYELMMRLSDLEYDFLPGSEYQRTRVVRKVGDRSFTGTIHGPKITIRSRVYSSKKVKLYVRAYPIDIEYMLYWEDGVWTLTESEVIGIL